MTLRAFLLAMALGAALPFGLQGGPALATSALAPAEARSAAETILNALRRGDAQAVFERLAPELQSSTSVQKVKERLERQGPILGGRITGVSTGFDDSTVEGELRSAGGTQPLVLVLDPRGRLLGWELDLSDTPIRQVATDFIGSIAEGRVVVARSLLSRDLQEQISPQDLLNRWKDLEKLTGSFQRLRGTVVASEGGQQQLVLVTTQFERLTDNLFVIFDDTGHIVGVDFPEEIRGGATAP